MEPPEKAVRQRCRLVRHQVERVAHQVAVEHCDGGGARAVDQMRQGGEMGLLAVVQRQRPGDFD